MSYTEMRHPKGGGPPPKTNALHGFAIDGRADLLVPELYKMQSQEDGGGLDVLQRTQRLRGLLDAEDEGGCTPLMRAAFQGSMECVRALLAVGADASLVSTITGRSPLHEAVASVHDQPELISLLIVAGADPKAQAVVTGNTALDIASQKVGPDGMLATSGECLLLKKFTQRDRFHQVDMSPLAPYAAELEALKFMATVGLPVGLAKHRELMSHVESQCIDLANLVATLGVERAVDSVFDTAAAAAGGAEAEEDRAMAPGTYLFIASRGRGYYCGFTPQPPGSGGNLHTIAFETGRDAGRSIAVRLAQETWEVIHAKAGGGLAKGVYNMRYPEDPEGIADPKEADRVAIFGATNRGPHGKIGLNHAETLGGTSLRPQPRPPRSF